MRCNNDGPHKEGGGEEEEEEKEERIVAQTRRTDGRTDTLLAGTEKCNKKGGEIRTDEQVVKARSDQPVGVHPCLADST